MAHPYLEDKTVGYIFFGVIAILLFLAGMTMTGCEEQPHMVEQRLATSNPDVPVELLFEHDQCKLYRFYDRETGRIVYYSNCQGGTTWTEPCGKGCTHQVQVPTSK